MKYKIVGRPKYDIYYDYKGTIYRGYIRKWYWIGWLDTYMENDSLDDLRDRLAKKYNKTHRSGYTERGDVKDLHPKPKLLNE